MFNFDLVLYHANCNDGFCAAWVAYKNLNAAKFIPVKYGEEPPDVQGLSVLIVDFSYDRETLLKLKDKARHLLVLDHHKTAEKALEGLDFCHFDMTKSGARLAWDYFESPNEAHRLVQYVEDRDLWKWELPVSKEINAALSSYPRNFFIWNGLAARVEDDDAITTLMREGEAILRYQDQQVEQLVENAQEVTIKGYKVLAVNTPILQSEVAGRLAEGRPFGVAWYDIKGKRIYSLRSRDPEGIDVSEIAKQYGGGGHRNAAGFTLGLSYLTEHLPCLMM